MTEPIRKSQSFPAEFLPLAGRRFEFGPYNTRNVWAPNDAAGPIETISLSRPLTYQD
ncbi:hypothetical protein RESH_00274 [Rhodopirellula europaea SH398]|uniref:Uncharacterized protein n=1 Tax=Rhodopirellula europaea SH398 TaxID=1263868 RepID=M5SCD9_9BACT|nr:hypothetical protein RESH_00274 [Rhodopirellula europaea SH398]